MEFLFKLLAYIGTLFIFVLGWGYFSMLLSPNKEDDLPLTRKYGCIVPVIVIIIVIIASKCHDSIHLF